MKLADVAKSAFAMPLTDSAYPRGPYKIPCWTARLHFDMKGTDLKGARVDDHASSRQGWRASVSSDAKGAKGLPND